ncbi:MAG: hypothetical protein AMXMBFR58_38350 [Phycisphaerae bacterium]
MSDVPRAAGGAIIPPTLTEERLLVVAGLSLKNLQPRVWDKDSEYYLPGLGAVMVSYADFHAMPARRTAAMEQGLHKYLGVPRSVKIYLDNGSFFFLTRRGGMPYHEYEEFVKKAKPDWWPIPQDFIPTPRMQRRTQQRCLEQTMAVNIKYEHDGFVPVMHVSRVLGEYVKQFQEHPKLIAKSRLALGGIVPNLLRASKAIPYPDILAALSDVRSGFGEKSMHVFGMGGTATLHLAALLKIDSVDSSGWRNRAARGLVQLPGCGDRMIADLGNWRGRKPSKAEWKKLHECPCPACRAFGVKGLKANGIDGFKNRATHNLWVLLNEAEWLAARMKAGTYEKCFARRLDNSTYLPLIDQLVKASRAAARLPAATKKPRR